MKQSPLVALRLDFRSGLPIYLQITREIGQQISGAGLKAGDQLPTVRALARELGINFNTVARAYRTLARTGRISTQRGRGTYIMEGISAGSERRDRGASLRALARQYAAEAKRSKFSDVQITRALQLQLKNWKDAG
jgi:GntR family transcriptional regulator